jgi:Tfp pilus assembly protein PilV
MRRRIATRGNIDRRSEAGDSLIEVLFAIVVIGLTVTAIMAALATSLSASAEHRSLATVDTVLKSYAEIVKYDIQLQPAPSPWFTECASVTQVGGVSYYNSNQVLYTRPPGYAGSIGIDSIQYWNGATFDSTCGPTDHTGYQVLTFKAVDTNGYTQSLSLGVRKGGG